MSLFFFIGIFCLQSRNMGKNVRYQTRILMRGFTWILQQHSLQQPARYITVSPAILQQLCHTARLLQRGDERRFDTFMCWECDNPSTNQMAACCLAGYTEHCNERTRWKKNVLYICLILQMSLRKILYSVHYKTTLSFPNFGCDLSQLSLCKLMPFWSKWLTASWCVGPG